MIFLSRGKLNLPRENIFKKRKKLLDFFRKMGIIISVLESTA
jgi:hypothetical protein